MTRNTLQECVRSGERKGSRTVVKRSWCPGRGCMALGADVTEGVLNMIRVSDRSEISRVTIVASARRVDIALRMAGNTLQGCMCSGERKRRSAMIEG